MKRTIERFFEKFGYSIRNINSSYSDIKEKEFWDIYELCKPYTMTSLERMYSLFCSVKYIITNNIYGDFVECGVWKGGSAMLIAYVLKNYKINNKKIFLYDTFEGMSDPTENDITNKGEVAKVELKKSSKYDSNSIWCYSPFDEVRNNLEKTGYLSKNMIQIKGKVEDTLPKNVPPNGISLLRLDTDWYESTFHELKTLYPLLSLNGILIIDDYGIWEGCRKAVDEYMNQSNLKILLVRIDGTARIGIKTSAIEIKTK